MNRNLTALILTVVAVGIYVTITQGIMADADQVKSLNDRYATAIADATRLIALRDQVLQQYNAISDDDRTRLDKMIPSTVDNIRLIIDLNGIADRHGLSFKGITAAVSDGDASGVAPVGAPSPAVPPAIPDAGAPSGPSISAPVLDTVTVSFGVSATYDQFISLLQDIEADLRIMDLTHLSVKASDTGVYDFNLQFTTYWIRQTT